MGTVTEEIISESSGETDEAVVMVGEEKLWPTSVLWDNNAEEKWKSRQTRSLFFFCLLQREVIERERERGR